MDKHGLYLFISLAITITVVLLLPSFESHAKRPRPRV